MIRDAASGDREALSSIGRQTALRELRPLPGQTRLLTRIVPRGGRER